MKFTLAVLSSLTILVSGCGTEYHQDRSVPDSHEAAWELKGNGAPSGSHYNLNLIGVPKNKTASMTGNNGHRIFIPLNGKSRILLAQGASFQVLDANGTDGSASFQMPAPDPDGDGVTTYSVFARPLGKPGGKISINTCATDPVTGEEICSLETMVSVRNKGGSKFENVSRELLSISADIDGDGTIERLPLFDDRLQDYLWGVDNQGLRLLQLRFYPVETQF